MIYNFLLIHKSPNLSLSSLETCPMNFTWWDFSPFLILIPFNFCLPRILFSPLQVLQSSFPTFPFPPQNVQSWPIQLLPVPSQKSQPSVPSNIFRIFPASSLMVILESKALPLPEQVLQLTYLSYSTLPLKSSSTYKSIFNWFLLFQFS